MREEQSLCTLSGPSDVYIGDSGSPLMVVMPGKGAGEEPHWVAVGIASWTERERPEDIHLPSMWVEGESDNLRSSHHLRLVHPHQHILRLDRQDYRRGGGVHRLSEWLGQCYRFGCFYRNKECTDNSAT